LALDLKDDVGRQTDTPDLDNLIANRLAPEFKNLNDDLLPEGLREKDLFNFTDAKYRSLKEQEFKTNFRKQKGDAKEATDEEIKNYFEIIFDSNNAPYYFLKFSEENAAKLFNNG